MEEGYRIVCLKDGSGAVLAVAGFRIFETFFDGKVTRSPYSLQRSAFGHAMRHLTPSMMDREGARLPALRGLKILGLKMLRGMDMQIQEGSR